MPVNLNRMKAATAGGFPHVSELDRTRTEPIPVARTNRNFLLRGLTSMPTGKMVPVAAFGLLREDQLMTSSVRITCEMQETVEILANPVNLRAMAYLVPFLAFDRFQQSRDQLDRAYMKQPQLDGGSTVTPFIETVAFAEATMPVMTYMGKHAREGQLVNTAYIEAYNAIYNYRAKNRSPDLPLRIKSDASLAKAFWIHQAFGDIVPDFDQASIEGEVPLELARSDVPVWGIGTYGTVQSLSSVGAHRYTPGSTARPSAQGWNVVPTGAIAGQTMIGVAGNADGTPNVVAELQAAGLTLKLSNIEVAKKTQAFAKLRRQYTGYSDEYIIDMLMSGLSIPNLALSEPLLLADRQTVFGMNKRYSTDSVDLTASVVNGGTFIDLVFRTPRVPTGGVIMILVEAMPEQVWERQQDNFMFIKDQDNYPDFMRDFLDPEKVEIVTNEYMDVDHDTPDATFGYQPLNASWKRHPPNIGGKFYRPQVDDPWVEDRNRIWACETENPTLSEDFYLCTNMHQNVFVDTVSDPFEAQTRGSVAIVGNTVFGQILLEASDDYDKVMEEAPLDTIDKPE